MAAAVAQPLPMAALPALPPHVLAALGETLTKKGETLPSAAEMLQALSSATARELPVLLPRLCLYGACPVRAAGLERFSAGRAGPPDLR
jgi:hypothetical protein